MSICALMHRARRKIKKNEKKVATAARRSSGNGARDPTTHILAVQLNCFSFRFDYYRVIVVSKREIPSGAISPSLKRSVLQHPPRHMLRLHPPRYLSVLAPCKVILI